ncbi:MAG: hypothetical protein IJ529_06285 [Alphaproteobacteria bacterium]|nr:hypothetical protein [Alphaproteobacteria bacterium]MBQ8678059.1 hypothetical protein [Alphaproteobacteria bacterium]
MTKKSIPEIPMTEVKPLPENCAHNWVKTEIRGRNALICKNCGKIIDAQD